MALPMADIETWLTENGVPDVWVNWMPGSPDTLVVVTASPGGPPTLDGHAETNHFHIRCRADTDAAAEAQALAIHALICQQTGSLQMGGTWVFSIEPASGAPAYLLRDLSERTTYIASYLVTSPTAAS